MVNEKTIQDTVQNLQGTGKTFAEFLAEIFKGQFIEVYVGDAYEDISTEQVSTTYPAVFCGIVIAAYRECLILNCAFVGPNRHLQMGNMMFINERAIRALNAVDGKGTVEDMMLRSKETLDIKAAFQHLQQKDNAPKT
jgi:hypothetical protein